jgi:hypothetical protein
MKILLLFVLLLMQLHYSHSSCNDTAATTVWKQKDGVDECVKEIQQVLGWFSGKLCMYVLLALLNIK